jgi:peroxiredoxin
MIVLGLAAVGFYLYGQVGNDAEIGNQPQGTSIGMRAPDFSGVTLDGERLHLSDFQGKIVVVNSFASWCGPCLLETPHLVKVFDQRGDEAVMVGINLQENPSAVAGYRDEFKISYPLVMDPEGTISEVYKPLGLPTSWFIGASGVVRYMHTGPLNTTMLNHILDDIRAGRQPDPLADSG